MCPGHLSLANLTGMVNNNQSERPVYCDGLMVSLVDLSSGNSGSSVSWDHNVVSLGKMIYSCNASPYLAVQMGQWTNVDFTLCNICLVSV